MKVQSVINGLVAALVLSSPIVGAEEYPAANFQPKVLYSDSDYKHTSSSEATTSSKKAVASKPDPKYPAANFQPEVVYKDANYKHNQTTTSEKKSSISVSTTLSKTASAESAPTEVAEQKSDDSMATLLGLVGLAAVGFMFFNKKSASCSKSAGTSYSRASTSSASNEGLTGVARYLNKNQPELSSVAKYLENKEKVPVSGVSKYMARKVVAAKAAAAAKTTGVEKYLRERG